MDESERNRSTRRALLKAAAGASAAGAASTAGCVAISTPADLAAANEPRGNVEYFVGPSWLAEHRDAVKVLDARQRDLFRRERIYGARRVPLSEITVRTSTDDGLVPDAASFAETFGGLGIEPTDDVVVYGASVGSRVTRTVFSLLASGHEGDVRILNGGLGAWNGRIGTGRASSPSETTYDADPQEDLWVTREWVANRLEPEIEDDLGLLDVRVPEAFLAAAGSDALDPRQERHGHVAGAVNVHWLGNLDRGRLRDAGELYSLYANDAGLADASVVVVYEDENVDSTQTWVTLRAIGFSDVRLYEGGFTEWSNVEGDHGRYPVETATDAVIDVEGEATRDDGADFTCN